MAATNDLSEDPRIQQLELRRELARVRARGRLVACIVLVVALGIAQWQISQFFAVLLGVAAAALGVAWDRWQAASAEDERLEQDLRALTTVYHESPRTIRKWLTSDFIDDSIRNLLAARLDSEDLAHGYWKQGVRPFLEESDRGLKTSWHYQIDLADLDEDVALAIDGEQVACVGCDTHRRLHTTVTYVHRIPNPAEMYYVAVVFKAAELPAWFRKENFLLREVVSMPEAFIAALPERDPEMTALPSTFVPGTASDALAGGLAMAARTVLGANVVVGEETLQPTTLHVDQSGMSWGFRLSAEQRERLRASSAMRVDLQTFMARSQQHFPVVIAAPTRNPTVHFNYALADGLGPIETQVFFNAERPWDARLRTMHDTYRRVEVLTEHDDWVFTGSGCIFAWWNDSAPRRGPGAVSAPQ